MRVAERGVGDEQALFFTGPGGKFFRAELLEELARAGRRFDARRGGKHKRFQPFGHFLSFDFGIAVEDHLAEVREQLGGAVAAARKTEQFRRIIEKRCGDFAGAKFWVIDDVFDERNVGSHAADAESRSARSMRLQASGKSLPQAVTLTRSES